MSYSIGSAVFMFIEYKQKTDRQAKYMQIEYSAIYSLILTPRFNSEENKFQIISLTILGIDILGGRLGGDNRHPSVQVQFTSNPIVYLLSCTIVTTISCMYNVQLQFTYNPVQLYIQYLTCIVYTYRYS